MSKECSRSLRVESAEFSLRSLFNALLLLGVLLVFAYWLKATLAQRVSMPTGGAQAHYLSPELTHSGEKLDILAWYELGKNAGILSAFIPPKSELAQSLSINFSGFSIGRLWQRDVPWHVKADGAGSLRVSFTPNAPVSHLAVFMTDGDTHWRSSRVYTSGTQTLAERLHLGKWLYFPLTEGERAAGSKSLRFQQLTGDNISLSALIILGTQLPSQAPAGEQESLVEDSLN